MAPHRDASGGEAPPARLFVAVTVPAAAGAAVDRAVAPWRARFPEARWVRPLDRHVTLRFFGAVPAVRVDRVEEAVGAVASGARPSEIGLGALGAFPSPRRARVLWVGLEDPAGLLASLAAGLDGVAEGEGPGARAGRERPYTPHLTVARSPRPLVVAAEAGTPAGGEPFPVTELVLFRSHRGRSPRYEALRRFPLGA